MGFGQFAVTTQFFLYGRRHFTADGWRRASAKYDAASLATVSLSEIPSSPESTSLRGKVYIVTGANSGIGFSLSKALAARGATLYMACRNPERAQAARDDVAAQTGSSSVHVLIVDCGLAADVRRAFSEFAKLESGLDGLICNAGALVSKRTLTSEGHEITYATHLLCGSYLFTQLALPLLRKSAPQDGGGGCGGRVVYVSSGGMYNTPWPGSARARAEFESAKFDGQMAYAYQKRGQVLLAERMAELHPDVKFVTCHPGWADTPGVESAYGSGKKLLQPMRNLWQGAEGIAWLCACEQSAIQSGAFYLDRAPQRKHLAGAFFSEGSYTKNSQQQVDEMMATLEKDSAEA